MNDTLPVYIGHDILPRVAAYCAQHALHRLQLIADTRTHAALGDRLGKHLVSSGFDVKSIVLEGEEIVADAAHILRVLIASEPTRQAYLAVGSGTITDITRFASHRTGAPFIAVPTAPSVDGFTSIGAPLVVDGLKRTILCQGPLALFADLDVLRRAPRSLIAAGFGDLAGKLLSAADWQLGHLLWEEPYSPEIAARLRAAAWSCTSYAAEIGRGSEEGVRSLMAGLVDSGLCMLEFGNSNPASGAEHHLSHYWEMMLLQQGRPAIFHGAKVGIASVMTARLYERIAAMSRDEAARRLAAATFVPGPARLARARKAYGPFGGQVIEGQQPFFGMTPEREAALKQRAIGCWDELRELAAGLPPAGTLAAWLHAAGGAVGGAELGLSEAEVAAGAEFGPYLRNRFTVARLAELLGLRDWWLG